MRAATAMSRPPATAPSTAPTAAMPVITTATTRTGPIPERTATARTTEPTTPTPAPARPARLRPPRLAAPAPRMEPARIPVQPPARA